MDERTNEQTNERMNERMNERTKEFEFGLKLQNITNLQRVEERVKAAHS